MPTAENLELYLLHLADTALILGHRNSEWTGHGPILEQDIALSNIALDLIGQSRNFYQYAAELMSNRGEPATEDSLAYFRDATGFRNFILCELPNGDWGQTILRQFFIATYQFYLYSELKQGSDQQLSAIAEKSLKEVSYHVRWSAEWVIRLGDGTEESHQRMKKALDYLWAFVGELFVSSEFEKQLTSNGITPEPSSLLDKWLTRVQDVLTEATLAEPNTLQVQPQSHRGNGKLGIHSEHLGFLLAEMQFLQRAYPGNEW